MKTCLGYAWVVCTILHDLDVYGDARGFDFFRRFHQLLKDLEKADE